ncbi:HNH endonuclease [Empedobacter stercoris]|uniref:HNH endonuclease n=1 Tax=Empedobacter stercoris TaxID=1628248 RepID=UPI0021AFBE79|nr:HNH endonuclease [Empedobacter stercoris]UWX68141.1 HNH endonuclease [Empedobacter stercoris]
MLNEKNCLWCNSPLTEHSKKKIAHTIPKSIGGKRKYDCECDSCNELFGNPIDNKYNSLESSFTSVIGYIKYILNNDLNKSHIIKPKSHFYSVKLLKDGKLKLDFKDVLKKSTFYSNSFFNFFKKAFFKIFISEFYTAYPKIYNKLDLEFYKKCILNDNYDIPLFMWKKDYIYLVADQKIELDDMNLIHIEYDYLFEDDNILEFEYLGLIFIMLKKDISINDLHNSLYMNIKHKSTNGNFSFQNAEIIELKNSKQIFDRFKD